MNSLNLKNSALNGWELNTNFTIFLENFTATIVKVITTHHCLTQKRATPPTTKRQTATSAIVEQPDTSDDDNQPVSLFTSAITKITLSNQHVD